MQNIEETLDNPFLAGHPIEPDNFFGRKEDVNKITRYFPRVVKKGLPEHFFIIGKKGMGKTSFVKYMAQIVEEDYNMFSLYVNIGGTNSVVELIAKLLDELFEKFSKTAKGKKYIDSFFNRFEEVNFGGFGVSFNKQPDIVMNVKDHFIEFLKDIHNHLDDYDGIYIIIDDINGLSETPEFVNWYKALFETLDFYQEFVPIVFNLVTYPAKFDQLSELNSSFPRMFNLVEMTRFGDAEVYDFFKRSFDSLGVEFASEQIIKDMVYYSCGMPLVMQQIGESIFWNYETGIIGDEIAYTGIKHAAWELKNKHVKILKQIKNPHFNNILLKLGKTEKFRFKKDELYDLMSENEKNILPIFFKEMLELNVLEYVGGQFEEYEFASIAYFAYYLISSTFNRLL